MPNTITPNKTVGTSLLAWQDIATANVVISSALDVSTKFAAAFSIKIARKSGTAFTQGWPNVRIEASHKSSGDDSWIPLMQFTPSIGASIANTTTNGAISAAAATFVVSSGTNITAGDVLFLGDSSTSNYELVRVKSISGTTVTPEAAIVNAHATAQTVTDQAEMYFPACDVAPYYRVRAVADNAGSGQTIAVEVTANTTDSYAVN